MKIRPLLLTIIHIALATAMIVSEEGSGAPPINEPALSPADCEDLTYTASYRVRAVYLVNLPAGMLFGWYGKPLGACALPNITEFAGSLPPFLRAPEPWRARVLEGFLVAAIGLQWWLFTKLARRSPSGIVQNLPMAVTIAGLVAYDAAVLESTWSEVLLAQGCLAMSAFMSLLLLWITAAACGLAYLWRLKRRTLHTA